MDVYSTYTRLKDIVQTYERLQEQRDAMYQKLFDSVSVNEAGEASASETLAANEWYDRATENLNEWFKTAIAQFKKGE